MKSKYIEAWNFMEVYIIYTTTYVCKQRVVALLLMELLSKMRKCELLPRPTLKSSKEWCNYLLIMISPKVEGQWLSDYLLHLPQPAEPGT